MIDYHPLIRVCPGEHLLFDTTPQGGLSCFAIHLLSVHIEVNAFFVGRGVLVSKQYVTHNTLTLRIGKGRLLDDGVGRFYNRDICIWFDELTMNERDIRFCIKYEMMGKVWAICGLTSTHCKYVIDEATVLIIGYPPVVIYQIFITNKVREYLKLLYNHI